MRHPKSPQVAVSVTNEIINTSISADSSHCMIAEAVRAARPDAKAVAVDLQTIRFSDPQKGLRYIYLTPRIAQVPLLLFDQGIKPDPFDFVLRRGHVTNMAGNRVKRGPQTRDHAKKTKAASAKAIAVRRLSSAKLVTRDSGNQTVDVVGGKPAPRTSFGNRRSFGLRALGTPTRPIENEV